MICISYTFKTYIVPFAVLFTVTKSLFTDTLSVNFNKKDTVLHITNNICMYTYRVFILIFRTIFFQPFARNQCNRKKLQIEIYLCRLDNV